MPDLDEFKARPGAAIIIVGGRREMVIESFQDVLETIDAADPDDWLTFTAYTDFSRTDKRVIQSISLRLAGIIEVEETNDAWLTAMDKEREAMADDHEGIAGLLGFRLDG